MKLRKFFLRSVIISLSIAAVIGIIAFFGLRGNFMWRTIGTVLAYAYCCLIALAASVTLERKRIFPIPWITIGWASLLFAYQVSLIWWEHWVMTWFGSNDEWRWLFWGYYFSLFFLAHPCLLWLPEKIGRRPAQTRWVATVGVIGCAWFVTDGIFEIFNFNEDDFYWRFAGALAILTGAATIVFPILIHFQKVERLVEAGTILQSLEIKCPRCKTAQTIPMGRSHCKKCNLSFNIDLEEPRCPKCEYLLHKLTTNTCPECGTTISITTE